MLFVATHLQSHLFLILKDMFVTSLVLEGEHKKKLIYFLYNESVLETLKTHKY